MSSIRKFVFVVHALNRAHRSVIGLRAAKLGLALGTRDGSDPWDVSTLCRFRLRQDLLGEVVAIPMLPEELLAEQGVALERMHRAVLWAERDGVDVAAVGLGALCSIVAGRGKGLQERLRVPVTTGNAATAYTLFRNCLTLNARKEAMAVLGAGSPVGEMVCRLLAQEEVPLRLDSKKTARKTNLDWRETPEAVVQDHKWIVGCGPTGPVCSQAAVQSGTTLIDVALPSSLDGKRPDVIVHQGETMRMPTDWHRGFWGPIYHLVSGYGWDTVLACLVEPLVLAFENRSAPYAQGRKLQEEDVLAFGESAEKLGFYPIAKRM